MSTDLHTELSVENLNHYIGDGWSTGVEVYATFDVVTNETIKLESSPDLGQINIKKGQKLTGAKIDLAYQKVGHGHWELLSYGWQSHPKVRE